MSHGRATSRTLGDEDPYIYKKGPAFGMPGVHVDGMDVLKVGWGWGGGPGVQPSAAARGSSRVGHSNARARALSRKPERSRTPCERRRRPGHLVISVRFRRPLERPRPRLPDPRTPLQVREVAQEAIARARRGDGPTLIEAETYRFRGHSLADPDELRSKEEKAKYQVRIRMRSDAIRSISNPLEL
jgi:hypothetical protein